MYFGGLIIGFSSFLMIGLFHVLVIQGEYHFGVKIWPAFLCLGIGSCVLSLLIKNAIVSSEFGVLGFCSLWSILELFHQKKRVEKGWFPKKEKNR
ncbi:MAG: DUF4491 family protein [Treponema sp.]|jgi:hypothetical protein|nr:DUF4491 family protein [Treponema sp.]